MLIPCVTVLLEYPDLFHTKCAKLPFLGAHFSNFPPIFPAFCSLLLPTYFSKKFAGKIGASLCIADHLAAKWEKSYSVVMGWVKERHSFEILRATMLCVWGSWERWWSLGVVDGASMSEAL